MSEYKIVSPKKLGNILDPYSHYYLTPHILLPVV